LEDLDRGAITLKLILKKVLNKRLKDRERWQALVNAVMNAWDP
jgi:hypothetical protein